MRGAIAAEPSVILDVFVMVKEYISSVDLAQQPLLVLTHQHRNTFPLTTLSPLALDLFTFDGVFPSARVDLMPLLLKDIEA